MRPRIRIKVRRVAAQGLELRLEKLYDHTTRSPCLLTKIQSSCYVDYRYTGQGLGQGSGFRVKVRDTV